MWTEEVCRTVLWATTCAPRWSWALRLAIAPAAFGTAWLGSRLWFLVTDWRERRALETWRRERREHLKRLGWRSQRPW